MQTLGIDIETFSSNDLKSGGVYNYVESSDFEILLFAYRIDSNRVQIIALADLQLLPTEILEALTNPSIIKTAWNAQFERVCIDTFFKIKSVNWQCTMVRAAMCGLPLSLEAAGAVMNLNIQKDATGKTLIRYFSNPCKPSKINEQRIRNYYFHDTEKWQQFKNYCIKDVQAEQEILLKLKSLAIPESEQLLYDIDQQINTTGVFIDKQFVENAIAIEFHERENLTAEAIKLTGLGNPNSIAQLKNWLEEELDISIANVNKETIGKLIPQMTDDKVKKVLQIRQQLGRTSVKKYKAMLACMNSDNRARGLFQYYGASRTGRWSGRLIQLQNLRKNNIPDLDVARNIVKTGNGSLLKLLYGDSLDTLSQLIRTAMIPKKGYVFVISDLNAIEARIAAWLAGEQWVLDVFKKDGKIYEATASRMFKIPIDQITEGSSWRAKGKVATLLLGYQGSVGALIRGGALEGGMQEHELQGVVDAWRAANPNIVRYWYMCQQAVEYAIKNSCARTDKVNFFHNGKQLAIALPYGRKLIYQNCYMEDGQIIFWGQDQTTNRWSKQQLYGGQIFENLCQSTARDVLASIIISIYKKCGLYPCIHVHDELVYEMPEAEGENFRKYLETEMSTELSWAPGLPLKAKAYISNYYKK